MIKDLNKEELEQIYFALEWRDYDLKGQRNDSARDSRFNEVAHYERELDSIQTAMKKVYKTYEAKYPQKEIR